MTMWPTNDDGTPQWVTETPTEIGQYFIKSRRRDDIDEAYVYQEDDELPDGEYAGYLAVELRDGNNWHDSFREFIERYGVTHWLGPLTLPTPPTIAVTVADSDNA